MKRLAALVTACFLGFCPARAEHILPSSSFEEGSGIEMRIINCYENIPPSGFLPIRVEVKNGSSAQRTWQFQADHSQSILASMHFVSSLTVEAGGERAFEFLVPIAPQARVASRNSHLQINISGYGVVSGNTSEYSAGSGMTATPFVGMGESLSVKNWGPLRERMEKSHSRFLDGSALDPRMLPEDWRGLAGFEILVFSDLEWRQIPATQRNAIQDWIIQGGKLVLDRGTANDPDLPIAGDLGSGAILHWRSDDDFLDQASRLLMPAEASTVSAAPQDYSWQWQLAQSVGRPEPPVLLIISFVVGFALVIGPLNFVTFAPLGQRHRLFWTTPSIALAASVVMGLYIVLSEGFGGSGERFEVVLNLPQLRKSVVWQEQISRTGVLASSSFVLSESSLILPLAIPHEPGTDPLSERRKTFILDGTTWAGDWFRSRAMQAQVLSAVLPTRAQVQIVTATQAAPSAVSTFDQELEEFWYFDEKGTAWKAEHLRPGEEQVLKRTEEQAFETWWRAVLKPAGPMTRGHAETYAKDKRKKFFASTSKPRFIASLATIRWKDNSGLILVKLRNEDFLEEILADVRAELHASKARRPLAEIRRMVLDAPSIRPMPEALSEKFCLIAEIKERSPSVGPMRSENVVEAADAYEHSPVVAVISVLTNQIHFGMSIERLAEIRRATSKPVLRKDFIFEEYQVREARAFGADAVLLMANVLDSSRLHGFYDLARELGMEALLEVHTEEEISALPQEARVVGINSRKFKAKSGFVGKQGASETDFSLDYSAFELAEKLPVGTLRVAESGLSPADAIKVRERFDSALVGTSLLRDARGIRACLEEFEKAILSSGLGDAA